MDKSSWDDVRAGRSRWGWARLNWSMSRFSTWRILTAPRGFFWAWETIDGPVYWTYYCGPFSVHWSDVEGWHWGGWNHD